MTNKELISEFVDFIANNNLDPSDFGTNFSAEQLKMTAERCPALENLIKEAGETYSELAERMNGNPVMNLLAKYVNSILQKTGNDELIGNIIYCTYPTRDFNACTFKLESGFVVLLNRGLFQFLSKFSRIFLVMMECTGSDEKGFFAKAGSSEKLAQSVMTLAFLILNQVGLAPDKLVQRDFIDQVSGYKSWTRDQIIVRHNLLIGIELFVFLHEISHIINGDLSSIDVFSALEDGTPHTAKRSHDVEFEADLSGFNFMVEHFGSEMVHMYFDFADFIAKNNYDVPAEKIMNKFGEEGNKLSKFSMLNNPEIFFGCIAVFFFIADLLDHAYKEMGLIGSGTHPLPEDRTEKFVQHFKRSILKKGSTMPRAFSGMLGTIEAVKEPTKTILSQTIKEGLFS